MDNQQGNSEWHNVMDKYIEPVAYTIGALIGDGSVTNPVCKRTDGSFQEMQTVTISSMDIDCIGRVCWEINEFFSKDYKIVPYTNNNGTQMYRLAINNTIIYKFFHYFISNKLNIPDELFMSNRKVQLDFLAGLFDTDGYIAEVKQGQARFGYSWRVGFATRHRTFIEDLTRMMQKLGVKVGSVHEQISGHGTTMYIIKPNIRSFIDNGCYFQIKRKADRISNYLCAMKPSETIILSP